MARTNNLSNFLSDVASAIKEKKGDSTNIPASDFDTEIRNLPSQGVYEHKTVNISQNGTQTVIPSSGYDAIDELTVNTTVPEKRLQTKSYSFTQNATLELEPDTGYDGFDSVEVTVSVPGEVINNQDKSVTPTTSSQTISADAGYTGLGTVTVNAVTSAIDSNILSNNIKAGVTILGVEGNVQPDKPDQTKTATPTTSQQIITPDIGYELASVTVDAVTSAVDNNIQASNIKSGVSILGVTGNYSGIDTSDTTAEAMYIADSKTAYANGEKITGIATTYNFKSIRTATPINFEHDYRSNIDYPDTTMLSNITPMTQSGVAKWKFVTPAISTNAPKPMGPGESVFIEGGKFILAVRESLLAQRFDVTTDNIKTGETILGINGAFSECIDKGVSNVKYKSYIGDGTFEKLASGYYKFDSNNMSRSELEITFTKDTAGDVKLSYKGSGLNTPDPENPESTLSYVYMDLDDSGTPLEPTDASNYTELTFSNVTVGEHTILIGVETGTDTVLEIKLLDETPISATNISKGLTGFVNGNKVEGTYLPDIEYSTPLAPSSWSIQDVSDFLEHISYAGANVSKINHTIDCTGITSLNWPSGFTSGLRYVEEFPTLVNTSGITALSGGLWTNFSNLKVIPLFDISGVTYADSIQNLYNVPSTVEEIPAFDLSSFPNPLQFVQGMAPFSRLNNKTNLSYESINNLLYTVSTINTQSIIPPYRTISRLGFESLTTDYDESIIHSLSNYHAFNEAGWTLS